MSTTIATGDGYEVSSTHESAEEMTEALSPREETQDEPRVLVDKGKKVEPEPEKDGISKAAAELGKKGGEAAAKARAKAEKEKARDAKAKADGESADEADEDRQEADAEQAAEPAPDSKKGNPRHDPQARVAQATREAREARERAEAAERRAAEVERRLEAAERARQDARDGSGERREQPQARPEAPAKPRSEDYESYDEYLDARDAWNRDQWTQETTQRFRAHEVATQAAQRLNGTLESFKGAVQKAREASPDFLDRVSDDVKGCVASVTLPPEQRARTNAQNWIADQFLSAPERAPALMLHLSEHPDEFQRIAALSSPRAVTWELAILSARLDAATTGTSARREVSKAKPPVTPVAGSPHTADDSLDDDAPYDAYVAAMNAKERRARR